MALQDLYQEIILDHYRRPHGRGLREPRGVQVRRTNPTCGDEIELRVHLEGEKILDVSYQNDGCSISQASASVLYDLLVGRTVSDAMTRVAAFEEMIKGLGRVEPDEELLEDGVAFAGVSKFSRRHDCALLAWRAFVEAIVQASVEGTGE